MTTANAAPDPAPLTVSVVVNTVDRANSLAVLLAALEHQSYPHFEVIVVVGPTHDHTLEVLALYAGRVQVLRCPRANLSESRNVGLLAARGEIVAFIDDDAVPSYHWLAQVVAAFGEPAAAVVGGSVYLVHPAQPAIQHWLGIMSDLGEQQDVRLDGAASQGVGVFWTERPMGANMSLRRRTLLAEGGFDPYFEWVFDDADVAMRLALAGHGVRSLTEAPVYHVPASSRNRVARTYSGRWWIVTKASTYFAVQNGRAAGQPPYQILVRVLHLVHGAWLGNWQLFHFGHISRREMWQRRLRAVAAGAQGALQGLGRRRLLAPGERPRSDGRADGAVEPPRILPFLRPASAQAPAVDPIDGIRPTGPLAASPRRIGVMAAPPIAPELAAVTQTLFDEGHTVHVVTAAQERKIVFQDGAFLHAELLADDVPAFLAGVRRLVENDGIELLVGTPDDLAAVAHLVGSTPREPPAALRTALAPLLAAGYKVVAVQTALGSADTAAAETRVAGTGAAKTGAADTGAGGVAVSAPVSAPAPEESRA